MVSRLRFSFIKTPGGAIRCENGGFTAQMMANVAPLHDKKH
jgi:hypothetical protein